MFGGRLLKMMGSVLLLALLATACGGGDDPAPVAGDSGDSGDSATASAVDADATFRWITSTDTASMDPDLVSATFYVQHLLPVYDRLVYLEPDGTVSPMLATDWEFIDGNSPAIDFTLRDDVTFHSGAVLDAAAVVANLERSMTSPDSLMKNDLAPVDSVEAVDATTVRINLKEPSPGLVQVLADRAGMMIDPAAFDDPELGTMGAGSGPWKVVERVQDSHTRYEKAEGYWDPEAQQFGALEILIVSDDDSRLNAVLSGQADAMELRPSQIERAKAEMETSESAVARSYNALLNTGKLGPEVRAALQHAIDREIIAQELLAGACAPAVQATPEGHLAHAEDVDADYFAYDPDLARQMLADAGVENLRLEGLAAEQPIYVQLAEALQSMFAEVGVEMSIRPVPSAQISDIFYQRKEGDLIVQQSALTPDPGQYARQNWLAESFINPGGDTTEEITDLVGEVSSLPPGEDLEKAWDELTEATREYAMDIILCNQIQTFGFDPKVEGLTQNILGSWYDFRSVSILAE